MTKGIEAGLKAGLKERLVALTDGARVVGLGTGRAATQAMALLGERRPELTYVATSTATIAYAEKLRLKLAPLQPIDVTFDGADEVDPELNLIKGYGGALVQEKLVARMSANLVILVGPEKLVSALGARGKLPVEVLPFALPWVLKQLAPYAPVLRLAAGGEPFVTDNHNYILDCVVVAPLTRAIDSTLKQIDGVVGTGLFFGQTSTVLVADDALPAGYRELMARK